jgi:hypothetical protein
MFPELPDASMETRKPIAFPQCSPNKLRKSSQTYAAASTQKTSQVFFTKRKNGRGAVITVPVLGLDQRLRRLYSDADDQRIPKPIVGW